MRYEEYTLEGRNAVIEAIRAGKTIDKIFILDGCYDGPIGTIAREAKTNDTIVSYVPKERLDNMSKTGHHQGVIAYAAAYHYATVADILENARSKGEDPFIFILDNIEDPHNLGAIIRTAKLAGAHGVIIPKSRAAGLTATVARSYEDFPCAKDFGAKDYNNYTEDVYVGYRYFETFNKNGVKYPFGYGLSYSKFAVEDIITASGEGEEEPEVELDQNPGGDWG